MTVTYFRRYRMLMDLRSDLMDEPELPTGFRIQAWCKSLLGDHADAKYRSFKNELDSNVFPCLGDSYGCHRLMRDISCRQGFVPESTWLIIKEQANGARAVPCGTIQGIREHLEVGAIQNIGIVPEFRGEGLGSVLVNYALRGFQRIGLKFATLEVTAHNDRAIQLYERLGFEITKVVYKSVDVKSGA